MGGGHASIAPTLRRLPLGRVLGPQRDYRAGQREFWFAPLSVELLVRPSEVELDAEQHDAVVGDKLPDDH